MPDDDDKLLSGFAPEASASEMGRARATVEQLQARVGEFEEELAAARACIAELEQALGGA